MSLIVTCHRRLR